MNLAQRIVCIPFFHAIFLAGAVINTAQKKPGIFITVGQTGNVDTFSPAVGVGAEMDLPVRKLCNLRSLGECIKILYAFSEVKACLPVFPQKMLWLFLCKIFICGKGEAQLLINAQHVCQLEETASKMADGSPIPTKPPPS